MVIKGEFSEWGDIKAGVPQGSILGPLLFLVYINDIVNCVNCGIKLFADDTILHLEFDDPLMAADTLNTNLDNIASWANRWLVTFSPDKTKTMSISLKNNSTVSRFPLTFNNISLDEVSKHKHLGLVLNEKLKWTDHIDYILDSVKKITDVFRYLKYKLDRKTLETIYKTYVRPKLEYGSIIFDDCSLFDKNRLENIQLTFARIVCGAKKGTSHVLIYNEINWPTLEERRKEHKLKFFYKIVNNSAPSYLNNLLPKPNSNPYNLRNDTDQKQFRFNTSKLQKSILPDCINLWNNLDTNIRQLTDIKTFKTCVTNPLVANPLYYGHIRSLGLIHSQLRMCCSNLKAHLYNLHVVDSPLCACMMGVEDSCHYFFTCPLYNAERIKLCDNINQLGKLNLDTLLYGDKSLSTDINLEIFKHVENFIFETERFA